MSNAKQDVLVVGCGVSGLSCGMRLLEAGFPVTIAARERPPQREGDPRHEAHGRLVAAFRMRDPFRMTPGAWGATARCPAPGSLARGRGGALRNPRSGLARGFS